MALPGYGIIDPNMPSDIGADAQRIARKRAVAEAMMKQAMTPIAAQSAPVSWTQGAAQLMNAYLGSKGSKQADVDTTALVDRYQQGLASEVQRIAAIRQGTPTNETIMDEQANGGEGAMSTITTPGQGNPRAAIEAALLSQYPQVRQMGVLEHRTFENELTRANDRAARLQERIMTIEADLKKEGLRAEERAARAAELDSLRRDLAAMNDDTRRYVADSRPQPAPSLSEVVDPKDPSRMLRIDTRQYRGGTLGDVGVIGISGKEPSAQKKEEAKEGGKKQVSDILATLNDHYNELEKMGGVISSDRTGMANVGTRIAASGPGQLVLGGLGTKSAATREKIEMTRPLLMQAIRQATGMSAKAMDSNAELKFYMQAATDPTKNISANRAAMALLDRSYGLGLGIKADENEMRNLEQQAKGQSTQGSISAPAPAGVDPKVWAVMTPEERALWNK
jgi:hypothetical protein